MTDPLTYFFTVLISLFAVIDPLGAVPIFLLITPEKTAKTRLLIAAKSALAVLVILVVFALFGHWVLAYFSISPPAFEIAGGLILIKLAYDLLWARLSEMRFTTREEEEGLTKRDVSLIPLAMPLLSGPGAIATVVVLSHSAVEPWMTYALLGGILLNSLLVFVILGLANPLSRLLKETGSALLTRIMGLILMAVGVQFVVSGIDKLYE
jgi:multiple antibiotic resistance protein